MFVHGMSNAKNPYRICRQEGSHMIVQMKTSCNASVLHEDANANVNVCAYDVYACDAWICPSMILWM